MSKSDNPWSTPLPGQRAGPRRISHCPEMTVLPLWGTMPRNTPPSYAKREKVGRPGLQLVTLGDMGTLEARSITQGDAGETTSVRLPPRLCQAFRRARSLNPRSRRPWSGLHRSLQADAIQSLLAAARSEAPSNRSQVCRASNRRGQARIGAVYGTYAQVQVKNEHTPTNLDPGTSEATLAISGMAS